uniref:Uncharacterized protein n=1 Tax=Oryza meridionalis TaxID=40149 RepID=A0A0E0ERR4_9ORYZ
MEGRMASSISLIPIPSLSLPSSNRLSPPLTPHLLVHACRRKVMKAISLKGIEIDATAKSSDNGDGDKSEPASVAYHHHYNLPELAMVVPVHLPYYAVNTTPYYAGGYYPMPPPMAMLHHPP